MDRFPYADLEGGRMPDPVSIRLLEHEVAFTATDTGDEEMTRLGLCQRVLSDLDANAAARVAHYLTDRFPFVEATR